MMLAPVTRLVPWRQLGAADRQRWQALWSELQAPPDQSPLWFEALIAGHGLDADSVAVVLGETGAELQLVWPLRRRTTRVAGVLRLRESGALQNVFCLHGGALSRLEAPQSAALLLDTLCRDGVIWDRLSIAALVEGSEALDGWRQAAAARHLVTTSVADERPPYLVAPENFQQYLATRSSGFRKRTRAALRELDSDASLRLQLYRRPEEMAPLAAAVRAIEEHSWKHAAGMAISSRPWETGFYDALLEKFAALDRVVGAVLHVDGVPAAHSIDLLGHGHVYGLKTSYDQRFAKRGVGTLILIAMVRHYFDGGCREYDFLGTDEAYKLEWTSSVRQHLTLNIHRNTWRARLALLRQNMRGSG